MIASTCIGDSSEGDVSTPGDAAPFRSQAQRLGIGECVHFVGAVVAASEVAQHEFDGELGLPVWVGGTQRMRFGER